MPTAISALVILALVAAFSAQNAAPVSVNFLFWNFEASLAIVIFLSFLSGALLAGVLLSLSRMGKRRDKGVPGQR